MRVLFSLGFLFAILQPDALSFEGDPRINLAKLLEEDARIIEPSEYDIVTDKEEIFFVVDRKRTRHLFLIFLETSLVCELSILRPGGNLDLELWLEEVFPDLEAALRKVRIGPNKCVGYLNVQEPDGILISTSETAFGYSGIFVNSLGRRSVQHFSLVNFDPMLRSFGGNQALPDEIIAISDERSTYRNGGDFKVRLIGAGGEIVDLLICDQDSLDERLGDYIRFEGINLSYGVAKEIVGQTSHRDFLAYAICAHR